MTLSLLYRQKSYRDGHQQLCELSPPAPNSEKRIKKTCPCNQYPIILHFYIVKLGTQGCTFLFLIPKIDCGYPIEPRGDSNERVPTINVLSKDIKNIIFFPVKFSFLLLKISVYYSSCIFIGQAFVLDIAKASS